MTNDMNIVPEAKLVSGVEPSNMICDDTPHWHTVAWELILIFGFIVIMVGFWRGWRKHRRGEPARWCANAIALATTLILTSSLISCLFSLADFLDLFTDGTLSYTGGSQMLLGTISGLAKSLGFSVGLATVGMIAYILLPSRPNKEDDPQPPPPT